MTQTIAEKKIKKYTYEDYCNTPEDKRYELINGELLMTPSPFTNHQRISRKLAFELIKFVTENKIGEVFVAPYDVYLDDENVVQPDILFIAKNNLPIIGEKNVQGAPDLVIEILSEHSAYRDMVQKKKLYARFGVREYWIVIPDSHEIEIYTLKNNAYRHYKTYNVADVLESPVLKGFDIQLKDIFEG